MSQIFSKLTTKSFSFCSILGQKAAAIKLFNIEHVDDGLTKIPNLSTKLIMAKNDKKWRINAKNAKISVNHALRQKSHGSRRVTHATVQRFKTRPATAARTEATLAEIAAATSSKHSLSDSEGLT